MEIIKRVGEDPLKDFLGLIKTISNFFYVTPLLLFYRQSDFNKRKLIKYDMIYYFVDQSDFNTL